MDRTLAPANSFASVAAATIDANRLPHVPEKSAAFERCSAATRLDLVRNEQPRSEHPHRRRHDRISAGVPCFRYGHAYPGPRNFRRVAAMALISRTRHGDAPSRQRVTDRCVNREPCQQLQYWTRSVNRQSRGCSATASPIANAASSNSMTALRSPIQCPMTTRRDNDSIHDAATAIFSAVERPQSGFPPQSSM